MNLVKTSIDGLFIIEPTIFKDKRGYFMESFNQKKFKNLFGEIVFLQDNESKSSKGVLRGLHFQKPPFAQTKLVRCLKGEILDVALDLRKKSTTYGQFETNFLSDKNKYELFIPKGFAHGFIVLSETATISYKVDNYYAPKYESGVLWNDKDLNIDWNIKPEDIILSDKDKNLLPLKKINSPF